MPATSNRNLTLTTTSSNGQVSVKIDVTYNAVFGVFERRLAGLGLVFQERIRIIGVDPPGGTAGTVLLTLPAQNLLVTDGGVPQALPRNRSVTVLRSLLQEDAGSGDNDEIRATIEIAAIGLPPAITPAEFTDQEVLPG